MKDEYISKNVIVQSRMTTKLAFQTFMDLTKVSCIVAEFKQAVTMQKTRPSLLSHRSDDIRMLWELNKSDIKNAAQ